MKKSHLQPQKHPQQKPPQRTLPAMLTSSGPIFVGYAKAAVVQLATEFMFVRELAWLTINPDYPARTSLGRRLAGDEVEAAYNVHAASLVGTFVVLSPVAQARFLSELLRYIEFHQDATGLEGILTTAIQSTWRSSDVRLSARALQVWGKYARQGQFAKRRGTFAYDELTRTLRTFLPGELDQVSPDDATLDLIARTAVRPDPRLDPRTGRETVPSGGRGIPAGDLNDREGPSRPDYRGDRGSWGGGPGGSRGLDDFYDGFDDPGTDYRESPSGWAGGPSRGGSRGRRDRSGFGGFYDGFDDAGPNYQGSPTSGSPDSSRGPGGSRDRFGSFDGFGFGDIGRNGEGIGAYRPQSGPFSEEFIGRPGRPGQEVMGPWENAAKAAGIAITGYGAAMIGAGVGSMVVTGGLSTPLATVVIVVGLADMAAGAFLGFEADDAAAAKKAADKAEWEKAAWEKAEADKAAKEKADKEKEKPAPDPKKKGESGLYPDPYGDGGGNPTTANLFQIPVDDSGGGGGVGPKWLNALPSEDGGGIVGPRFDYLPDSDGSGGGTPSSVYEASLLTVAGPGLESLCVRTSGQMMLILGMPKLANNGSVLDPGLLGALVR